MSRAASPITALLVLAVLAVAAAGSAAASPEYHAICPVCEEEAFDDAGGERTVLVSVGAGDGTWRVEGEITNESLADEWRSDPPAVDPGRPIAAGGNEYEDLSVEVTDDDRLAVTFTHAGATRPGVAGTQHLEYFPPPGAGYVLNVHEFTVEAPDGHLVATNPPGATVDGDRVTWRADPPDDRGDAGKRPATIENGHVVFASQDAVAPSAGAWAAIATAALFPTLNGLHPLYWAVLYVGFGGVLAYAHVGRPAAERLGKRSLAVVVVVAACLPVVVFAGLGIAPGQNELSGPIGTLASCFVALLAGLLFGLFGVIGYGIAAGTAADGRV